MRTPTAPAPAGWPRFGVYKADQYTWFVESKSVPGAYRRVAWHHDQSFGVYFSCSCPSGYEQGRMHATRGVRTPGGGRPCRHVAAVAHAEGADGYQPRPQGKIDASAFVD